MSDPLNGSAGESEAEAFAVEWIAAFDSLDLERILSHYADDVVLVSPVVAERLGRSNGEVCGKSALRAYLATGLYPGSPLSFSLRRCYGGVGGIVLEYDRHDGRRGAEFMGFGQDGRIRRVVAHYVSAGSKDG